MPEWQSRICRKVLRKRITLRCTGHMSADSMGLATAEGICCLPG